MHPIVLANRSSKNEASLDEIAFIAENLSRYIKSQGDDIDSSKMFLAQSLPYRLKEESPLAKITTYAFLSACYYALGDIDSSIEYLEKHIDFSEKNENVTSASNYQVRDYLLIKNSNSSDDNGGKFFEKLWGRSIYDSISNLLADHNGLLKSFGLPKCYDCSECDHKQTCQTSVLNPIFKRVHEQGENSVIDQKEYFDGLIRHLDIQ